MKQRADMTDLARIAATLRTVAASTEIRFVDIAERLGRSGDLVSMLTATFATLSNALNGESLREATDALARVAERVACLARGRSGAVHALRRLAELTAAIQGRVGRMAKSVDGVGMLATNAKIAVAHIGENSLDLASFAGEINRTLGQAEASLAAFAAELAGVGRLLRDSMATQTVLEARQDAAARAIPERLGHGLSEIADRGRRATSTANAVGEGSRRVGRRIADAILALQIGDSTRQRIEHVVHALELIGERAHAGDDDPEVGGIIARLQAAQLLDTADSGEREIGHIVTSLHDLGSGAREIARLGHDTFGAPGEDRGSFIGPLEREIGEVETLLAGFGSARGEADRIAVSVADATDRLVDHIGTVRSLEADIRIMGLNISFKCGRLGPAGRPLSVIAQELRLRAGEIASEAGDVMTDLQRIAATAGTLAAGAADGQETEIAAITESMTGSLSRLTEAGLALAAALERLARDGGSVADLLGETAARITDLDEMSRALRAAAVELEAMAPDPRGDQIEQTIGRAGPAADRLLDLIAASYTMEAERAILTRHAPWRARQHDAPPRISVKHASESAELEDILF